MNLITSASKTSKGLSISHFDRAGVEPGTDIVIKPGEDISGVTVFISEGTGVIVGRVNFERGAPPAEGRMVLSLSRSNSATGYINVDANGRFRIDGLTPGTYRLSERLSTCPKAAHTVAADGEPNR